MYRGGGVQLFLYLCPAGQTVALYDPLLPAEPLQSGSSWSGGGGSTVYLRVH